MLGSLRRKELGFLQEGYSKAAMLLASEKHQEAEALMTQLIHRLQQLRPRSEPQEEQLHDRLLAECYANLACCLFNREDCEDSFQRIRQLLEQSIQLDCLGHWAYYNLASYHFRTSSYHEALECLHCALSCLYLLKAVLSRDLENRNREIDLGRAISYAHNNLQARYVRLLMQLKQNRWKMAANELELALEGQPEGQGAELRELKTLILSLSNNAHLGEARTVLKRAIELIGRMPAQRGRLQGTKKEAERGSVVKEIDDRIAEFNELFRQVNELGCTQNLFMLKAIHRTSRSEKRIHILSNTVQPPVKEEPSLSESMPRPNITEFEAKVIDRMNQSKRSLTESKGYGGESLFELTKSQNLESSNKFIVGNLLSSLLQTSKPATILPSEVQQVDNDNETFHEGSTTPANMEIQAIQSQIQPLPDTDSPLISATPHCINDDDDLLLDSLSDPNPFKKPTNTNINPNPSLIQPSEKKEEASSISIYPLGESKMLELTLLKAEFREELREKLVGIYAFMEYNSGYIDHYKFRSRQASGPANEVEWSESLGFIRLAEDPKTMLVKVYKAEPFYYNDKFLGEGEIEVTAVGVIKIPLYLNRRSVGSVSVRLVVNEEGPSLSCSFKRSATSNSESQSSQFSHG